MEGTIVNIATYKEYQAAYLLKNRLDSRGIGVYLSYIEKDVSVKTKKEEAIKVRVKDYNVEEAIEIMMDIRQEYGKEIEQEVKHYRRILVPVDFTEMSVTACQYAFAMNEKLFGEIRLLHAYEDPLSEHHIKQTSTFEKYHAEELLKIERQCDRNIFDFTEVLKKRIDTKQFAEAKFHYSMVIGSLDRQIFHMSESYKPNVIIIGCGKHEVRRNCLSEQLALKVAENIRIPLLVIPEEAHFKGVEHLRILYATDFLDPDFTSFRKLLAILAPFKVKYYCIHVEQKDKHEVKIQKMNELREIIKKDYSNYNVKLMLISNEDMIAGIQDFVRDNDINVISFTAPRRSMIYRLLSPNNLKIMIRQSRVPLLVFHT
jgi:nucleotide-binding universal stress UspA family protein